MAPIDGRARIVLVLLGLVVVVDLLSISSNATRLDLLGQFMEGVCDTSAAATYDARHQVLGGLDRLVFILTAIAFMVWFHRAFRNIDGVGGTRSNEPRWIVWGLLIPVINFYKPYQLMRECFAAFGPHGDARVALLGVWWGLYLLDYLLIGVLWQSLLFAGPISELCQATSVEMMGEIVDIRIAVLEYTRAAYAFIARDVTEILAALSTMAVVRTLTAWQSAAGRDAVKQDAEVTL